MTSYVFNRASNEASNGGLHVATSLVKQFVQTLAELEVQFGGQARALKLPCLAWDLAVTQDAEGNGVSLGAIVEHFYDHGDTRELATFFDALQVYAPAEEALDEAAIDAILRLEPTGPAEGHEGMFEAVRDAGYEAMQCIVTGGTLVSLAHPRWDFDQGVIGCNEGIVRFDHASHTTHADAISGRILSHVRSTVTRQNFATIRAQAFPPCGGAKMLTIKSPFSHRNILLSRSVGLPVSTRSQRLGLRRRVQCPTKVRWSSSAKASSRWTNMKRIAASVRRTAPWRHSRLTSGLIRETGSISCLITPRGQSRSDISASTFLLGNTNGAFCVHPGEPERLELRRFADLTTCRFATHHRPLPSRADGHGH
jgi:hypothetical protein